MARNRVSVGKDHITRLAQTGPLSALEELIWNALDSGSRRVEVHLRVNKIGGVQDIEVADQGTGIPITELDVAFGHVGDSKKIAQKMTKEGRLLHGREGKGRFKSLSLCSAPKWQTVYKADSKFYRYEIVIDSNEPDYYTNSEPSEVKAQPTGTKVVLKDIKHGQQTFDRKETVEQLTQRFALYLTTYPGIEIIYDGKALNVKDIVSKQETIPLPTGKLGRPPANLTIIEWKKKLDSKQLYLCNEAGFCRNEIVSGIRAPGIEFTAYLSSSEIEQWHKDNLFIAEDGFSNENVKELLDLAKGKIREYVRERMAEEAQDIVEQWKMQEIYPYKHETANPIQRAEKQVFDIVAVRVSEQHPTFNKTDLDNKKLTLALIRQALESNPSSLTKILKEVVNLPKEDQDALADLLKRTPLTALIQAGSLITQRLDIIQAFENIIFERDWKKRLQERTQLHRLLVHELWILGEGYALDCDDESLTEVLKKHIKKMGRDELAPEVKVKTIGGVAGIPDLLLSRRFKYSRDQFENLVIELKRPSVMLGAAECTQIEDYAFTVAADERFNTQKVKWTFVLIGNDLNEHAKNRANSTGLPPNCISSPKDKNLEVYVRCWADVFADTKARHEFFREKLQIEASKEYGMDYLEKTYPHLMAGRGASKKKDNEITGEKRRKTTG